MRATVFGAGNIGRGLIGVVLHAAGYDVTYVDASADLVAALDGSGSFRVITSAGDATDVPVASVLSAFDTDRVIASVAESDLIATAVGAPILKIVAEPIAAGLASNQQPFVNVLACENAHPNGPLLLSHVQNLGELSRPVGFPEVVVDRIVSSEAGALDVLVEENYEFIVDAVDWQGPPAEGIAVVEPIDAFIVRKLWLVNGLHAACAYLGLEAGYTYIHEAMGDERIAVLISEIADHMVQVLEDRYPTFASGEFARMAAASQTRFADPQMIDPVHRVGRNPLAKLQPDERLLAAAIGAGTLGADLSSFAAVFTAAASGVDTDVPGHEEFLTELKDGGIAGLLRRLDAPETLVQLIETETNEGDTTMNREVTIQNPSGLHARPAAMLVEAMKGFEAKVQINKGDKTANAASIMSVLALGAVTGDVVTIAAEGDDAEAAADYVEGLMLSTEDH